MSAATDQKHCEDIMIAMLALQSDLASLLPDNIVHFDNEKQASATNKNRIVVQAMPRTVQTYGKNEQVPFIYSVMVKVTVHLAANDPVLMDTYVAAIEAANSGSCPVSIVTLATNLFGARGFDWFNVDEGERDDTDNERQATQTWEARFGA